MAYYGVEELAAARKARVAAVVAVLVLLSFPSLLGYNVWLQRSARAVPGAFATQEEVQALEILRNQSGGTVLSDRALGSFIPYYTGKNALLFSGRTYPGLLQDVNGAHDGFFSENATEEERRAVIEKYGVEYILLRGGENSLKLPDGVSVLKDGGVTLPAAKLHEIARSLPDGEVQFKLLDRNHVAISCDRTRYKISGQPRDEFPALYRGEGRNAAPTPLEPRARNPNVPNQREGDAPWHARKEPMISTSGGRACGRCPTRRSTAIFGRWQTSSLLR